MPNQAKQGKTAVGLLVDGLQLKYAQLSLTAGKVILREFKTVTLPAKLEEKAPAPITQGLAEIADGDVSARIGEELKTATAEAPLAGVSANANALLELLKSIPAKQYTVSIALAEPAVRYYEFDTDFGVNGTKRKEKISEKLGESGGVAPALDSFDVIPSATGGLLCIARQGGLPLYDLLTQIRGSLNGNVPKVKLIHSADVALEEIVRSSYDLPEDSISAIAYVGSDYSRVVILQGNHHLHFAPIINEGYATPGIENTLYSRIRLERENIAHTKIDRIFLAGESDKINLLDAIAPQFPEAKVEYLKAPDIDRALFPAPAEVVSEYAIPISVAWRALQPNLRGAYDIDLLPTFVREAQKAFGLAWHGWLTAALMVVSVVYFSFSLVPRAGKLRQARQALDQRQEELATLNQYKTRKKTLTADMSKYEIGMKEYRSIAQGAGRWTRILDFLAANVGKMNSIWIQSIRPVEGNPAAFDLGGRSYVLSKIPALVGIFEKASLLQLRTVNVRNQDVYEFDIRVEKVDKDDIPYIPPAAKK